MRYWEYKEFTDAVHKLTGIDLSSYNERQMKRRIDSFMARHKSPNYNAFYQLIATNKEINEKFINYITINVTEFLRNPAQWEKLRLEILPKLIYHCQRQGRSR